jgi:hypothetical protein
LEIYQKAIDFGVFRAKFEELLGHRYFFLLCLFFRLAFAFLLLFGLVMILVFHGKGGLEGGFDWLVDASLFFTQSFGNILEAHFLHHLESHSIVSLIVLSDFLFFFGFVLRLSF